MNNWAVRFTSATTGAGSARNGETFVRTYQVSFPYTGNYTITAAADNIGTLRIAGVDLNVGGFNGSNQTVRFYTPGTYNLRLTVENVAGTVSETDVYSVNPYGIAITVNAPPAPAAPTISFSASPSTIIQGSSSTLSWTVTGNVSSVSINQGIGSVSTSGTTSVSPTTTTTYTITATGEGGTTTRTVTLTVNLPPPPTISFSASPTSIILSESSTLSWSVGGSVSSVSINQGIGSVSTSGNRSVSPTSTTTYTITATGIGGTTTRTVTVTVSLPPPPTISFSASPSAIIRGSSSTLSWGVTGILISSVTLSDFGSVATSGTRSVSPTATRQYTLSATNPGGTTTRSVTITVYQPPNVTLSLNNPTIIRGQSTTLNWVTTGDAGSASITPGIGAVNINGNRIVSPTETTTYVINVSGLGGSDSDSITLIVYQPPTVNLTGPASINYEQQGTLTYSATNIDISLGVTPTYNYRGSSVTGAVINLSIGTTVSGSIATQIPYNDFGPFNVQYVIVATGNGGQESKLLTIPINIDETPTNFLVPESEELLKSQDPVTTPDAVVTSYEIVIDDVDIPVEIKADRPILVDINNTDTWIPIREI
jgi:hypothetical protein